jgi:hypothetical protein
VEETHRRQKAGNEKRGGEDAVDVPAAVQLKRCFVDRMFCGIEPPESKKFQKIERGAGAGAVPPRRGHYEKAL